jgi:hypothetical protein
MKKESFERGFIKAALNQGLDALTAVDMLKEAQHQIIIEKLAMDPRILGALAGGGIGAVGGAMTDPKHRGRNALMGGLLGAGAGGLAGQYQHGRQLEEGQRIMDADSAKAIGTGHGPYSQILDDLLKNQQHSNAGMEQYYNDVATPGEVEPGLHASKLNHLDLQKMQLQAQGNPSVGSQVVPVMQDAAKEVGDAAVAPITGTINKVKAGVQGINRAYNSATDSAASLYGPPQLPGAEQPTKVRK